MSFKSHDEINEWRVRLEGRYKKALKRVQDGLARLTADNTDKGGPTHHGITSGLRPVRIQIGDGPLKYAVMRDAALLPDIAKLFADWNRENVSPRTSDAVTTAGIDVKAKGDAPENAGGGSPKNDPEGGLGELRAPSISTVHGEAGNDRQYVTTFGCKGFTFATDDSFTVEVTVPVSVQITLQRNLAGEEIRSELLVARPPKGLRRYLGKHDQDAFHGLIDHGDEMLEEPEIYKRLWNWRHKQEECATPERNAA